MSQEQQPVATGTTGQAQEGAPGQAGEAVKTEPQEKLGSQFAALARKEKALRMEAQRIKSEREAIQKEREQFKSPGYITKEQIMKNPIGILTEHGWSPNQIAEMLLNEGGNHQPSQQDQTISKLLAKIEELEGKTKSFETHLSERETNEKEQAIAQIRNDVKILIDSDPAYETIKASNKFEAVVEHIKQTYEHDGIILPIEEAAKEVEDALVEEAMKLATLTKIQERLKPKTEPQQPVATNQKTQQQQPIKTLTHDMVSTSAQSTMSAKDRVKRAVMRAQGLDPDTGKPLAG